MAGTAGSGAVDVSRLSDYTVNAAEDYLREYGRMDVFASRVGRRLVSVIEARVSPPPPLDGVPSDMMATVPAVRRKQLGISAWPGSTDWPGVRSQALQVITWPG